VLVADEGYLPHAKAVFVNAKRQGQWRGDYCLIAPPEIDAEEFEQRGIRVLLDREDRHYRKFAVFDDFFQQWDIVLYADCDVLIQNPLEPLLHEVGWGDVLADRELFTLEHAFTYWATPEELQEPDRQECFKWLWSEYDRKRQQFNTGVMLYHPRTRMPFARERLIAMRKNVAPVNCHVVNGTDQPIFNLVFYDKFARIRSDLVCYWNSTWDGTIITHTCSGYAPWIDKQHPDQDAYWCRLLNRPMHDIYLENLAAFAQEFPKRNGGSNA
jgi:lipopolysaccharide biosynthesis glycosyltransferase